MLGFGVARGRRRVRVKEDEDNDKVSGDVIVSGLQWGCNRAKMME